MDKLLKRLDRHHLLVACVLFVIFMLRFPSHFEPFWYGDEGIFAAVARNLNLGGTLYQTAWDNKPPMIYLTYAGIFQIFGVSMFWLRIVTSIVVLTTAAAIYEIGRITLNRNRAVVAALIFGVLTSLRLVEGNLALTEIFMILPITLGVLLVMYRKFDALSLFIAGFLMAVASLYKQVGAFETAAVGIYLFLITKSFTEFIKKGLALSFGFAVPYVLTVGYFYFLGLLPDYIFGAYTYYRIYLGESPQYAVLVNVSKYLPVILSVCWVLVKKFKKQEVSYFHLFLLWLSFSFLGSYFSGRTYGHYLVQAIPAISLIIATIDFSKLKVKPLGAAFAVLYILPILFLTRLLFSDFLSGGPINQVKYWKNFIDYANGKKSLDDYNNFFDGNVNTIVALYDSLKMNSAFGGSVYIWGDYPWLYAMLDAKNPSRYVTSFHVFGVPGGKEEVMEDLLVNKPNYIVKPQSSIGYFPELEKLIVNAYTPVAKINSAEVFVQKAEK